MTYAFVIKKGIFKKVNQLKLELYLKFKKKFN